MKKENVNSTFGKLYALLLTIAEKRDSEMMNDFQLKNKTYLTALNTQVSELFEKHVIKGENGFEKHKEVWWKFWQKKERYKCKSREDEIAFAIGWKNLMNKQIKIYY